MQSRNRYFLKFKMLVRRLLCTKVFLLETMTNHRKIYEFGRVRQDVRVLSFYNFGNLGNQLKTRYDDALGEK